MRMQTALCRLFLLSTLLIILQTSGDKHLIVVFGFPLPCDWSDRVFVAPFADLCVKCICVGSSLLSWMLIVSRQQRRSRPGCCVMGCRTNWRAEARYALRQMSTADGVACHHGGGGGGGICEHTYGWIFIMFRRRGAAAAV